MRKLILVLLLVFSTSVLASEGVWSIQEAKGQFWLKNSKYKTLKALITKRSGKSKVVKTIDVGKNYEIIVYYSGAAGTFNIVEIHYGILFDKKTKRFLGDFPWKYKSQTNNKKLPNPKWSISDESITITDEQTDLNKTIELISNK